MNNSFWIFLVVLISLISRLPQILTPYFHVDGDECVLGLMAQQVAAGHEFPFYFWGQHYGFSWIEASAAAVSFKIFGVGVLSLKIPMLLLWTLGCVFFYCAMALWTSRAYAFCITSLLIFSPAWMAWSMMARGGYITAFLLSSVVLFILAQDKGFKSQGLLFFIGILMGFIFFSQPMFLVWILPLLVYVLQKQWGLKNVWVCVVGFVAVFILAKLMTLFQKNTDFWNPAVVKPSDFIHSVSMLWERIYRALNQYALSRCGKVDWASHIVAYIWQMVLLICCATSLIDFKNQKLKGISAVFGIGTGLVIGSTFLLSKDTYADRYLLSLGVLLILWFGVQGFQWMKQYPALKIWIKVLIGILIVLGICVSWNYRNYYRFDPTSSSEVPEMQKIPKVIEFLEGYGIKYVFSIDDDLSWKISFFSRQQIIARWMNMRARQPAYPLIVNQGYLNGERTALVGNAIDEKLALMIVAPEGRTVVLADQYFIHLAPTKKMIVEKMGFEVN